VLDLLHHFFQGFPHQEIGTANEDITIRKMIAEIHEKRKTNSMLETIVILPSIVRQRSQSGTDTE